MTTLPCPTRSHSPRLDARGWSCPDCPADPVAEAHAAAVEGMARATEAHPDERSRVEAAVRRLAATGKPFSANTARDIHGVRGGVVGATFNALRAEGLIAPVGAETSTDKGTHGKAVALWVGTHIKENAA